MKNSLDNEEGEILNGYENDEDIVMPEMGAEIKKWLIARYI